MIFVVKKLKQKMKNKNKTKTKTNRQWIWISRLLQGLLKQISLDLNLVIINLSKTWMIKEHNFKIWKKINNGTFTSLKYPENKAENQFNHKWHGYTKKKTPQQTSNYMEKNQPAEIH